MAQRRKVRSVDYGTYKRIEVYPNRLVVDMRTYKSDVETYNYFKRIKEEGKDIKLFGGIRKTNFKHDKRLHSKIKIY